MSVIKDQILEDFYKKLSVQPTFTEHHIAELRRLLAGAAQPKAAEIGKALSEEEEVSR